MISDDVWRYVVCEYLMISKKEVMRRHHSVMAEIHVIRRLLSNFFLRNEGEWD